MRKRIADISLDLGSIVYLVLAGWHRHIRFGSEHFLEFFPAVERDLFTRIIQKLFFKPSDSGQDSYSQMLTEFLTDPGRAGEHALDGPKFALVTRFLLDCFIPPFSEWNFVR